MKTLDFSKQILTAKGEAVGQTGGELLSDVLMTSAAKPPLSGKYFAWGIDLAKTGKIQVDDVDAESLKEFIDNNDKLTVMSKGRLKEMLLDTISNPEGEA